MAKLNKNTEKEIPLYQQIKDHFLERMRKGEWKPLQKVLSENELVQAFGVSRMTANRALRELTSEGYLTRVTGVGTFVADDKAQSDLLEICNIADEISDRGHLHTAKVFLNQKEQASDAVAAWMDLKSGANVFHSIVLHYEQGRPIQLEDRYVNKSIAPRYDKEDFTIKTPNEYLMKVASLQEAEHTVQAIMADSLVSQRLCLHQHEACLLVKRRTWAKGRIATVANLYHPGSRYELSGRLKRGS